MQPCKKIFTLKDPSRMAYQQDLASAVCYKIVHHTSIKWTIHFKMGFGLSGSNEQFQSLKDIVR